MKLFRQFILVFSGLFFMQCEEVIHLELDTLAPKLVVDASIDWQKGTAGNRQTVTLTTTTDYYTGEVPVVSGATVVVATGNKTFAFAEVPGTGRYVCTDFEPAIGEIYTLAISYNGQNYTASETFVSTPDLQRIEQINDGGFDGDEIEVFCYFQDDGSVDNFYMSSVQAPFIKFPIYTIDSDERSQGNEMYLKFEHEDTDHGNVLDIRLSGISSRYHSYMSRLLEATATGGPFPTTPAGVRGNIINQTDKENYALGYFRLSEVITVNYIVE
ncbi:MAG: DUF4249 domain-containing protein [Marivirga sp.]|nr:DUF4249 domain-containing protein [Marivirga sp.]